LSVVIATDHSQFMTDALAELCRMQPTGLKNVIVLTANAVVGSATTMLVHGLPELGEKAERWISEKVGEENQNVCQSIASLGASCTAEVREGYPNAVIGQAMAEHCADLLILGAPPHSSFERFAFGSVSAEEVLNAPYSVLALRP